MNFLTICIFIGLAWAGMVSGSGLRPQISLDGTWEFRMDPKEEGVAGKWFDAGAAYPDQIQVPGNWQSQGFGEPKGHLRNDYQGVAWYRRTVEIPADWKGRQVWAHFGGVTAFGDIYVNGKPVGTVEHYLTPHEFNITSSLKFGETNTIACRVDSVASSHDPHGGPVVRPGPVGMFNFWGHWGGLYRPVWLEARPDPSIDTVFMTPDINKGNARAKVVLRRSGADKAWEGNVRVRITPAKGGESYTAEGGIRFAVGKTESEPAVIDVAIPNARLWSPEDPFLYQAEAALSENGKPIDTKTTRFGMREITAGNGKLLLNGKPYFIRGFGDDYVEPVTGTLAPDKDVYLKRIKLSKEYGFNAIRYLGHTPTKEVFDAADELGFLILAEAPAYWNHWPRQGEIVPLYKKMVPQIIREFHNHPSWYAWSAGNEFLKHDPEWQDYLKTAYDTFRQMDPKRLFISSEGTRIIPMDIVTDIGMMGIGGAAEPRETLNQPFQGDVAEVAYFRKSLGAVDITGLAKGTPDYAEKVRKLEPTGYWRLNEKTPGKVADSSGHGRDGATDPAMPAESFGQPGIPAADAGAGAIRFSAGIPPIDLGGVAREVFAQNTGPFSLSLWLKPQGFAKGDFGTPFSYGAALAGGAFLLSMDGEEGTGKVLVGQWGSNLIKSRKILTAGEWNHLGITYDGAKMTLFVNGEPDTEAPAALMTAFADAKIGNVVSRFSIRDKPFIWHEFNNTYAGSLPDLSNLAKYTGVIAGNDCLTFHAGEIEDYGLTARYPEIRQRSIDFFGMYLKDVFESARKQDPLDGYNYWLMTDLPGGIEGDPSCLGIFNMFYEADKFPDPKPLLAFNRESVLLLTVDPESGPGAAGLPPSTWHFVESNAGNRVIAEGASREVRLSVSHYGAEPIRGGSLTWRVMDRDQVVQQGRMDGIDVEIGNIQELGKVMITPEATGRATKLVLEAELAAPGFSQVNRWDFWAYPARLRDFSGSGIVNLTGVSQLAARYGAATAIDPETSRLVLADKMTPELLDHVDRGGSLILLSEKEALKTPVPFPFWPQMLKSLGTVVEDHPAISGFSNDGFCSYQFYRLFHGTTAALDLTTKDSAGRRGFAPIVWGIKADEDPALGLGWNDPKFRTKLYRAGMISEGRIGKGNILVCSLSVLGGIGKGYPEAGFLLDGLVNHALSSGFEPDTDLLTKEDAAQIFK